MKYLNTYKIFESKNIKSIIDEFKECFIDIEHLGIKVEVTYDDSEEIIMVFIDELKHKGISVNSIIDSIEFANSYCAKLGLIPEGVNYTYYDPEEEETLGSYQSNIYDVIRALTKMNFKNKHNYDTDNVVYDLLLVYKFK